MSIATLLFRMILLMVAVVNLYRSVVQIGNLK